MTCSRAQLELPGAPKGLWRRLQASRTSQRQGSQLPSRLSSTCVNACRLGANRMTAGWESKMWFVHDATKGTQPGVTSVGTVVSPCLWPQLTL